MIYEPSWPAPACPTTVVPVARLRTILRKSPMQANRAPSNPRADDHALTSSRTIRSALETNEAEAPTNTRNTSSRSTSTIPATISFRPSNRTISLAPRVDIQRHRINARSTRRNRKPSIRTMLVRSGGCDLRGGWNDALLYVSRARLHDDDDKCLMATKWSRGDGSESQLSWYGSAVGWDR